MDAFTKAYIETMLWASTDDQEQPLDNNYGVDDLSPELLRQVQEDCQAFQEDNWNDICHDLRRAGQDFWLTRNGHGSGFWDGAWPEAGERLTEVSKPYGSVDLYVVDEQVYGT